MATRNESTGSESTALDSVREFVDKNRLLTYFLLIEVSLVVTAYWLDTWTSFTLEEGGADLTDITAGLLGGWAVVFGLLGVVGFLLMAASRLWIRIDRR
ncbi:hypothetical protein [Halegenticoccus tardaugens]|uniref:hypothetical protein n=1 Tax=Halegenticoccus tardaugens TaxID=2071624 RepID=UPI00100A3B76|nr:hypothetical protein [Halegenticoccus tardaugens]